MKTFRQSGKRESERHDALVRWLRVRRQREQAKRRGVLLLVVLSMLTLFLLIGTAFIVSANHYRKTQKMLNQVTETSNSSIDQGDLLNEVIGQLLRDTNNQNSALRFHSLLGDMYGNDGIIAEIDNTAWAAAVSGPVDPTNGQFIQFQPSTAADKVTDQFGNVILVSQLSRLDNAYNGLVATFLDGPARGQSTRVISYLAVNTPGPPLINVPIFRVLAPRLADGSVLAAPNALNGSRVMLNGRPFNGTGAGFNQTAGLNTARLTAREALLNSADFGNLNEYFSTALMPNSAFFDPQNVRPADYLGGTNPPGTTQIDVWNALNDTQRKLITDMGLQGIGGSDESYDAYDFQNMILGLMTSNPIETTLPNLNATIPPNRGTPPLTLDNMVLPSFHRPALLNYWRQQLISGGGTLLENEPNLLRKVLLRPSWLDHPEFTGSNPEFANAAANFSANPEDVLLRMIYGPWDVDNDNDGVRDSIWVDFGAPVRENSDGKLVKPLAAVLVLDMDGRLNLNAHGGRDIADPPNNFNQPLAGGTIDSDSLPSGQGFGPAEISLNPIIDSLLARSMATQPRPNAERVEQRLRFLEGVRENSYVFEEENPASIDPRTPDATPRRFSRRAAGRFGNRGVDILPGVPREFDLLAQIRMQGVPSRGDGQIVLNNPDNVLGNADDVTVLGGYGSLADLRGRYAVGLNALGQPIDEANRRDTAGTPDYNVYLNRDTPYELDLSLGATRGENVGANPADTPFTSAELERILRPYDPDAGSLPSRIWDLARGFLPGSGATTPDLNTLNLWRTSLTTDSYDLPVPNVVVPGWMVVGPNGSPDPVGTTSDDFEDVMGRPPVGATFADLLEYRLRLGLNPANPSNLTALQARTLQRQMLKLQPADLANGLRLDINRPLGNGRDDNNNGVVDEPGEWNDVDGDGQFDENEEEIYWASNDNRLNSFTSQTGTFRDDSMLFREALDADNNGVLNIDDPTAYESALGILNPTDSPGRIRRHVVLDNLHRQVLARDLYIMAQTLVDPIPVPNGGVNNAYIRRRAERARQLAQWAINVVDFRDPDNIMTAFEYDADPFDGWDPDGNLATVNDIYGTDGRPDSFNATMRDDQGGLVWGAERPELLITETLGWHDRATENTNKEDPANDEDLDGFVNDDDTGTVPTFADENANLPDTDYDQRVRPRGAAFVELYCPYPANPANNADTHGIDISNPANPQDLGVNLAAVATDPSGTRSIGSPVWRLMMYKDGGPGRDPDSRETRLRPQLPDRSVYFAGFDPQYPSPTRFTNPERAHADTRDLERYVNDGVAFFNETSNVNTQVKPVPPGGYMVVGSGESNGAGQFITEISSPKGVLAYSDAGIVLDTNPNPQYRVRMQDSNGQLINDAAGFPVAAQANSTASNVEVAIINQVGAAGSTQERRFTFSEPANGYPRRVEGSTWDGNKYVPTVDIPLDDQRAIFPPPKRFGGIPSGNGGTLQARKSSELNDGEIRLALPGFRQGSGFGDSVKPDTVFNQADQRSRTIPGFKWVYLQRLANPTLPWNPEPFLPDGTGTLQPTPGYQANLAVNPYLTIDSMGTNVTVYNGLSPEERRVNPSDPANPILRYRNQIPLDFFSSLQRGRSNDPTEPADPDGLQSLQDDFKDRQHSRLKDRPQFSPSNAPRTFMNLWNPEAIGRINSAVTGVWRNVSGPNGNGVDNLSNNFPGIPDHTLGFLNEPFRAAGGGQNELKAPFPWLTWNNRPYANDGELLQVPAFGSSQLLASFTMRDDSTANTPVAMDELYDGRTPDARERKFFATSRWEDLLELTFDNPYGHLLNFFRTEFEVMPGPDNTLGTADDEVDGFVGLHRLMDYVHVPSLYVGTETWLNPAAFGRDDPGDTSDDLVSFDDPRYGLQPPFNKVSSYREPGRVNINTISDENVYFGIMHGNPDINPNTGAPVDVHTGPSWIDDDAPIAQGATYDPGIVDSRRGYDVNGQSMLKLDARYPTFFANPFRSSIAGDLVPVQGMLRSGVDCTLLRREGFDPGVDGQWGRASVDDDGNGIIDDRSEAGMSSDPNVRADDIAGPLFGSLSQRNFNNADRNAYFRYQPMSRLSSMTTTRSNVYAVWVTIGFFEVQEAPDIASFVAINDPSNSLSPAQQQALYERVYPEGYQLGQEAGSDVGDVQRVREFAIVDRTVPVAFEPGKNHNVDKAIRLRRRIE